MANELMAAEPTRWEAAKKMAQMVSQVPGFAYYKKPAEAMLVAMKAFDLGLSFTEALEQVYVVKGRTAIQGALMLKRIYEAGHEINFTEVTDRGAKIEAKRKGQEKFTTWSFTLEDAKRAGLLGKDIYRQYPADMFLWRCVARAARYQFSDCLGGATHLPEEIGSTEERDVTNLSGAEDKRSDLTDVFNDEIGGLEAPQSQSQPSQSSPEVKDRGVAEPVTSEDLRRFDHPESK